MIVPTQSKAPRPIPVPSGTQPDPERRIRRLSAASARQVVEPDVAIPGRLGEGAVVAPELLSVAGLDLDLSPEQLAVLSREEIAAITASGLRFEAVLMAGFSLALAGAEDLTDPRVVYALHEIGEETRHSRLFSRLLGDLHPRAVDPLDRPVTRRALRRAVLFLIRRPALLDVLVLAGEEIPDLIQKRAADHPGTDSFLAEINRYHRQEEARHLAFARTTLAEHWSSATLGDRLAVRHLAPRVVTVMFEMLVHPGVYETVGLPGWATWKAANRTPERTALRHQATRPVLRAMTDVGVVRPGRIPTPWRRLCGVDAAGTPLS